MPVLDGSFQHSSCCGRCGRLDGHGRELPSSVGNATSAQWSVRTLPSASRRDGRSSPRARSAAAPLATPALVSAAAESAGRTQTVHPTVRRSLLAAAVGTSLPAAEAAGSPETPGGVYGTDSGVRTSVRSQLSTDEGRFSQWIAKSVNSKSKNKSKSTLREARGH